MRSELISEDDFFIKMKKKPALQAILDNLDSYSVEQLENISGQPLWIRKQLVKIKSGTDITSRRETAAAAALKMVSNQKILFPDKLEIRQWQGPTGWLKSNRFELEVKQGDLFLVLREGLVLWGHSAVKPIWGDFLSHTQSLGFSSKQEYLERLSASYAGVSAPTIGPEPSGLSAWGVRIQR